MRDISIYIHIPFCVRKCLYCDFLSFPISGAYHQGENASGSAERSERASAGKRESVSREDVSGQNLSAGKETKLPPENGSCKNGFAGEMESYVNLLRQEIEQQSDRYQKHRVISVFFGGGTPSLLTAEQLGGIMGKITTHYTLSENAEITIEMNPGTVTEAKLRAYKSCGINRISIGLQSTDNEELTRIGRIHTFEEFLDTYRAARRVGFTNINIDLMAALPGQSLASYRKTLERAAALAPEHISAYSLILEEGTPLYARQAEYAFPDEEEDRQMYQMTRSLLAERGYRRYEISNYAREGYECRHNQVYWQRGDYVGFGLGAASMVEECRWSNPADPAQYAAYVQAGCRLPGQVLCPERHRLTIPEQMEEFMFLGLRMMCGVKRDAFYRKFGQPIEEVYGGVLQKLDSQGLLAQEGGCIRLTDRGIDVSNYVMAEFLFD